jgi:hypothetical protein
LKSGSANELQFARQLRRDGCRRQDLTQLHEALENQTEPSRSPLANSGSASSATIDALHTLSNQRKTLPNTMPAFTTSSSLPHLSGLGWASSLRG